MMVKPTQKTIVIPCRSSARQPCSPSATDAPQTYPVAPLVRDVVTERLVDVVATRNGRVSRRRSGERADLVRTQLCRVAGSVRRDIRVLACEVDALELVVHSGRKSKPAPGTDEREKMSLRRARSTYWTGLMYPSQNSQRFWACVGI
jgi:hypothetical protein